MSVLAVDEMNKNSNSTSSAAATVVSSTTASSSLGKVDLQLKFATWVTKPIIHSVKLMTQLADGLEFVVPVEGFIVIAGVPVIEALMDKPQSTNHMFTVYNKNLEKVYYVGTSHGKSPGCFLPFRYRIIDQYERYVFSVKKYLSLGRYGRVAAEVYCPPGKKIAFISRYKTEDNEIEYTITKEGHPLMFMYYKNENDLEVTKDDNLIATITITQGTRRLVHVNFANKLTPKEKCCILSATLLAEWHYIYYGVKPQDRVLKTQQSSVKTH